MPDLSGLRKYAKAGMDVIDEDVVYFINGGEIVKQKDGSQKLNIGIRLASGDTKILAVNNTSLKAMQDAYGGNSDAWVNKPARVNIVKMNTPAGIKDVIILSVPDQEVA